MAQDKGDIIGIPTMVALDKEVAFADCCSCHTFLITNHGLIYSFGCGQNGCLGHGSEEDKYKPTLIDALREKNIRQCAGGHEHSLCVDENESVWSFGQNANGQCGLGSDVERQLTPKVVEYFVSNNIKAKECSACTNQYSAKSAVISQNGNLYLFGCNEVGQLGLDEMKNYYKPTKVPLPQDPFVQRISMGFLHTTLIAK